MFHLLLFIIYLAFISLGLPDALLGSAWPNMVQEFHVPLSYAGYISFIISACTVISSLQVNRMVAWLGSGKTTAISTFMTAISLFGFAMSSSYWMLLIWAIPYGLGAGCVDACLNNYVANHFASRHMSWLHCMWGIGAFSGPLVMGAFLTHNFHWSSGYFSIGVLQAILTIILFITLSKWQKDTLEEDQIIIPLKELLKMRKAQYIILFFFCYCAIEHTVGLWASSYFTLVKGMDKNIAATLGSLFFIGIAFGRFISGFLTYKFNDKQMILLGMILIICSIGCMLLPGTTLAFIAFCLCGLGCAPLYPSMMHSIPMLFDKNTSQSVFGIASAAANAGIMIIPPIFGMIASHLSISLLPYFLIIFFLLMFIMNKYLWHNQNSEKIVKK
ncbi:MAG: MFS transporter [Longicatena sp.]|nr:MFS transporter [Longicatena sp.]